jgi:hypothetical protein
MSSEARTHYPLAADVRRVLGRRWQSVLILVAMGLLYALVSGPLRLPGAPWRVLAWGGGAILVLSVVVPFLHARGMGWLARAIGLAATAGITLVIINSVRSLALLPSDELPAGRDLFLNTALIWSLNVLVFALWYWEIDGGGPIRRGQGAYHVTDFAFPQFQLDEPSLRDGWQPNILDYLFLSFCTSTAFGPADTIVLSRRGKVLMIVEALISLVVGGVLVGRAVGEL